MTNTLHCVLLLALYAPSCGAGTRPPAPNPAPITPPPVSAAPIQTITGNERVAWDQELLPDTSIEAYEFAVYVNGARTALLNVTCGTEPGADGATCSVALPPLRPGRSTLEFVAALDDTESERSDPLEVQLGAGAGQTMARGSSPLRGLRAEIIATGLERPTDLAMLPDGRLLITERRGRVRVVAAGDVSADTALILEDVAAAAGLGVFAIAAHPDFARNRYVYLAYTARRQDGGATYRVIRTRELNNALGEVAIVHESVEARPPAWMSARFGPDGKLYVGVAACVECGSAFAGVVLRLNDDGSTPRDSASPVYVPDLSLPVALSWRGDQLWIGDWQPQATSLVVRAADGVHRFAAVRNAGVIVMQPGADAPAVMLTRPHGAGLHRYRLRPDAPTLERDATVVDDRTTVHAMLHAADGTLYICASDDPNGAARLMRVTGWQ